MFFKYICRTNANYCLMAKKKLNKEPQKRTASYHKLTGFIKNETLSFIIGLLCVIIAVYMLLAFTSFFFTGAADQSILENPQSGELVSTNNHIQNYAGARGAQVAEYLINGCFGIPAYFIAVFLGVAGLKLMKAYNFRLWKWFLGCSVLLIWGSIFLGFIFEGTFGNSFCYPGGLHGHNVSEWIVSQIGATGLALLLLVTAILFCIFLSSETIHVIRKALHPNIKRKENTKKEDVIPSDINEPENTQNVNAYADPQPLTVNLPLEEIPYEKTSEKENGNEEEETLENMETKEEFEERRLTPPFTPQKDETILETPNQEITVTIGGTEEDETTEPIEPYNPKLDLENYHYPTIELLKKYEDNTPSIDMAEQTANKNRIIEVLRSFNVEISSINATVGPTITLYEITPAQGVRIAKIRNLENDIALSLAAEGIRIIAPIPGKGTIGIEVPNARKKIVPMRDIITSKKFQESTLELPLALGKTITNEVFMVDLAKAPHMLVAGATGMGKSVGLNAIVTSLLYKKHPAELKFVIIDPKKVEFAIYAPIERHFLAKLPDDNDAIITDVSKVVQTLNSLCKEMDTRYDLLKLAGCRNLKEYNAKFIARQLNPNKGHKYMPYIVVIIDEFGDLIMTAGKEIELPICRIAQLARAVGIHAIIATQRPTTNIITGAIKANFPARVAFRVAAMIDSRTILDRSGAQQLIGKGDMLYLQGSDPVRVQCAFVDTPEVERIADYISHQQGYTSAFALPEPDVSEDGDSNVGEVDMKHLDPMFEDAARLVIIHQQGSTSLIQRKFAIGYNRAGRIMDQLEKAGIVGPAQGSKAREVLCMDETDLEMRLSNLQ